MRIFQALAGLFVVGGGAAGLLSSTLNRGPQIQTTEEAGIAPGEPGWGGISWTADGSGDLVPDLIVTGRGDDGEYDLHYRLDGDGVTAEWKDGPYLSGETAHVTIPVELVLPSRGVQIHARVFRHKLADGELTDTASAPLVLVTAPGTGEERWVDAQQLQVEVRSAALPVIGPDGELTIDDGSAAWEVTGD